MTPKAIAPSGLTKEWPTTSSEASVFLASASYEDRSLAVAEAMPETCRFRLGLLYANEEFMAGPGGDATTANLDRLRELLSTRCDEVLSEAGSWLNPAKQLHALQTLIAGIRERVGDQSEGCVNLDATTFTRESLVVTCALVRRQIEPRILRLFYAAPKEHGDWLSRGFRSVRNVMGFAGLQVPGARTVLVVLSGFEPERTSRIIDEHEPSCVLMGIGDPPTDPKFLERNLKEQALVLARQDVEQFKFSTTSAADCLGQLESLIEPHLGCGNIIVAPMSTKLSTVAAMMLAEKHPSIQLTYCLPGEYNTESYSKGTRGIFVEEL